MSKKIIIGSRGSKLALLYAQKAKDTIIHKTDLSDEVIFMDEGMIVEKAETKEFFANPKNDRTKLFLSQIL